MTSKGTPRLTIRLDDSTRAALDARREKGESISDVIRRAIRVLIAGLVLVLVVLGLSACGGTEPSAQDVTPVSQQEDAPEVEASEPVVVDPNSPEAIKARAKSGDCYSFTFGPEKRQLLDEFDALANGAESTAQDFQAFLVGLDGLPPACSDGDQRGLDGLRTQAAAFIESLG